MQLYILQTMMYPKIKVRCEDNTDNFLLSRIPLYNNSDKDEPGKDIQDPIIA